jgi:hypothetical protein
MQPMARAMQAINPRANESSAPTDVGQLRHYAQNGCLVGFAKTLRPQDPDQRRRPAERFRKTSMQTGLKNAHLQDRLQAVL